jgi:hypothetical protein
VVHRVEPPVPPVAIAAESRRAWAWASIAVAAAARSLPDRRDLADQTAVGSARAQHAGEGAQRQFSRSSRPVRSSAVRPRPRSSAFRARKLVLSDFSFSLLTGFFSAVRSSSRRPIRCRRQHGAPRERCVSSVPIPRAGTSSTSSPGGRWQAPVVRSTRRLHLPVFIVMGDTEEARACEAARRQLSFCEHAHLRTGVITASPTPARSCSGNAPATPGRWRR